MYSITALNPRQAQVCTAPYPSLTEFSVRNYTIHSFAQRRCVRAHSTRLFQTVARWTKQTKITTLLHRRPGPLPCCFAFLCFWSWALCRHHTSPNLSQVKSIQAWCPLFLCIYWSWIYTVPCADTVPSRCLLGKRLIRHPATNWVPVINTCSTWAI